MVRKPARHGIVAKAVGMVIGHLQSAAKGKRPSPVLLAGGRSERRREVAAGVAEQFGVALYTVDLSQAVNKYTGETEKNLAAAFGLAQPTGGVLFFDEADALFGNRAEVKDSHDRYTNALRRELKKRLARYGGLVLLGSGQPERLDRAFLGRPIPTVVVVGRRPGAASRSVTRAVPDGSTTLSRARTRQTHSTRIP